MFNCEGACWAFSATGAMEGINKIVTGTLVSLSEQELVDCDRSYNNGCNGGLMDYAFEFVVKNQGIDNEEDYPFQGGEKTCNERKVETFMARPVSLSIDVFHQHFKYYLRVNFIHYYSKFLLLL